jgi:putative tryptophan/tyrosine transport system substrate-binding protein
VKRRSALAALAAAAAGAWMPGAIAARPWRIYMVTWRGMTDVERGFEGYFAQRGIPVEYTWRDAGQSPARVAEFAREARELRPDLVYTWGTSATLGMAGTHDAPLPTSAPIVFALVADPVGSKIVPRLSGQDRDVTGVFHVAPIAAQLRAMRAYRPFTRLGVLYNTAEANSVAVADALEAELARGGARLLRTSFASGPDGRALADGIEERVQRLRASGAQWLYLGPDTFLFTQIERVAATARQERLPTFATTESLIESPAPVLAGLVSRYRTIGAFAAYKAEQILAARKRARDLPVETLSRFSFIVRVEVARALDVLPPVTLLNFAEFR